MKRSYHEQPNGYLETIEKGLAAVRSFRAGLSYGTGSREENIALLKHELETADAIVIGAGAGLSTAAGLTYSGERFERYFFDFIRSRTRKHAGHGGRGISTITAISTRRSRFIRICLRWSRIKTIS